MAGRKKDVLETIEIAVDVHRFLGSHQMKVVILATVKDMLAAVKWGTSPRMIRQASIVLPALSFILVLRTGVNSRTYANDTRD